MKIELRNVKYAAFASEETTCFEGTLYIDGVSRGVVSNDGRGGAHRYSDYSAPKMLSDYASSLPARKRKLGGKEYELAWSADCLVDEAFERAMQSKKLQSALRSKIVILDRDELSTIKWDKRFTLAQYEAHVEKNWPGSIVLNALPFEQALDRWMEKLPS